MPESDQRMPAWYFAEEPVEYYAEQDCERDGHSENSAATAAKREGVQIKLYAIIYELIDQVKEGMAGLLDQAATRWHRSCRQRCMHATFRRKNSACSRWC